jgi:hypothetical protein
MGPVFDCDPKTEKLVTEGMACGDTARTTTAGAFECDPSRKCGGVTLWAKQGKRPPCDIGPGQPSPGVTPPPIQEGDPCTPGEPLPPGFKCKSK